MLRLLWLTLISGSVQVLGQQGAGSGSGGGGRQIISTVLKGGWEDTSMIMEAAEFMADENNNMFWNFIDHLQQEADRFRKSTDHETYQEILSFASRYFFLFFFYF